MLGFWCLSLKTESTPSEVNAVKGKWPGQGLTGGQSQAGIPLMPPAESSPASLHT